eukprot:TRINITY_DN16022_c0_g1_i1.p1 TRINITY_DN16022_c0_g1~~TRINITY_DN16022_c0_g1_i1.p1  ORF type:complete len:530 (-),score=109.32 TRINITY_DN16022_c0_g1_i1:89-1678(-)
MPIARRPTPPTSQIKEQVSVLGSLSAWTDSGETEEEEDKSKANKEGYRLLHPKPEEDSPSTPLVQSLSTRANRFLPDVESDKFNSFIGITIVANAIVIGLETDFGKDWFSVFEHLFNMVFLVEAILRIRHFGCQYFKEAWNVFDFLLVFNGTLDLWILPLVQTLHPENAEESEAEVSSSHFGYSFSVVRLLRILRLLRVLRVIRLFRMFHQLFLIMQAFAKALQIVGVISVLVLILDYVCAIALTQGVGQNAAQWGDDAYRIEELFGSISASMHTLFGIMTVSDWDSVHSLLIAQMPSPLVTLAFVVYIMMTTYTMVALVNGIISESLITSQQDYKRRKLGQIDTKRKNLTNELREFLTTILEETLDDGGCANHEDLKQFVRGDQDLIRNLAEIGVPIGENGILQLVDKLSHDGQDRVNVDFFVDKLTNLTGAASMSSLVDVKYSIVKTQSRVASLDKMLSALAHRVTSAMQSTGGFEANDVQPQANESDGHAFDSAFRVSSVSVRSSLKIPGKIKTEGKPKKMRFADE